VLPGKLLYTPPQAKHASIHLGFRDAGMLLYTRAPAMSEHASIQLGFRDAFEKGVSHVFVWRLRRAYICTGRVWRARTRERRHAMTSVQTPAPAAAAAVTLANKLASWLVRGTYEDDHGVPRLDEYEHPPSADAAAVPGDAYMVLSHLASDPGDIDQWIKWRLHGVARPLLIDARTAQRMDGHRVSFVVSMKRALGPVVHAVELKPPMSAVPSSTAVSLTGAEDDGTADDAARM
jgi:hypothetical protein